jgi:tetratricopeptide (TPR) repeat protein
MNQIHNELKVLQDLILSAEFKKEASEALEKFKDYLEKVKTLGPYNELNWPVDWTSTVWDFASNLREVTKNTSNLSNYIGEVTHLINNSKNINTEILEFILCELSWDSAAFEVSNKAQNIIKELYEKYPNNLEFKHAYAHFLTDEGIYLEKADQLYKACIAVWKNKSPQTLSAAFTCEYKMANKFLQNKNYDRSIELIRRAQKYEYYKSSQMQMMLLYTFNDKISDTKTLHSLIEETKLDAIKTAKKMQGKSIELLGLFTAIIAFIMSTVSVFGKVSEKMILPIILAMGIVLILFVSTISYMNDNPKNFLKDFRFYLIVAFLGVSIALAYNFSSNQSLISKDEKNILAKKIDCD